MMTRRGNCSAAKATECRWWWAEEMVRGLQLSLSTNCERTSEDVEASFASWPSARNPLRNLLSSMVCCPSGWSHWCFHWWAVVCNYQVGKQWLRDIRHLIGLIEVPKQILLLLQVPWKISLFAVYFHLVAVEDRPTMVLPTYLVVFEE